MNRKLLLITLLSALALFSSFPTALALAESTTELSSTTPASNQSSDDTHEEELVLIPELLDRLEGDNTDDTDLGPEIKEETVNSNGNKITESEPDLMDIEDDSDAIAEIYKETHPNAFNDDVVENQEKNLLNINHGSIHEESYDNIPDNGDAEVEQEDFGGQPQSDESDGAIATESVNIDDQYHDFNVEPCTAVLIPINKQKVEVSVNGVSNAITAMLTDKQFTNCTDLINFACPEGASFCRKLSLNFQDAEGTDEENEAFQLNNEACGVNNAYLYVLPGDMAISLSYQVRVEANGAPQCANEEDEPTLNEMMGSESEEINDEDSSSDDTDTDTDEEIQEDLNDDPFQMFDNKIIEEHEVINGKPRTFEVKICTVVEIPVHGKAVNIVVDTLVNAKKMMVTDAQMSGCSDLNAFECPQNSTFCKVQDLSEPDGVQLTTEACDLDTAYLYVLPEEFDGISSYQVNTTVLNQNACELKNSEVPVVPVETTEETTKPSETPEATESQSDDSSDSDSENASAQDTEDIATADGQTVTEDNTDAADPEAIGNVGSKVDGGMIFVIVFVTSLVLFMGVVCYYRYQFRKNRVELFHPPSWCPQCLFPRANEALISVKGNNAFDSDYEPPVL